MNILIWLLTAVHVIVAVILVVLVLMQKSSEQGVGAAFGGQMTETVFGGSITPLVKMTIYCACILLGTTVLLAALHARRGGNLAERSSIGEKLQQGAPAVPGPAAPATPAPLDTPAPATPVPAPAP